MVNLIGFHINKESLLSSVEYGIKKKCKVIQFILTDLNTPYNLTKNELKEVRKLIKDHKILLYIHASYNVNLCKEFDESTWWMDNLLNDIKITHELGGIGVVVHFGKQLELSKNIALNNMYFAITYLYEKTRQFNVQILLENTAGQGTELCYKIQDIDKFFKKLSNMDDKIGLCLDTCHLYSGGNKLDFNNYKSLKKHVKLLHLNNSKTDFNSRVDRHECLKNGTIKYSDLIKFVSNFNVPICIETSCIEDINLH